MSEAVKRSKSIEIREEAKKDHTPKWDDCEFMDASTYAKHWHYAMQYYNLNTNSKDAKFAVLKWMALNGYSNEQISLYKTSSDWQTSTTMGAISSCLIRGMPDSRDDFNKGKSASAWLIDSIDNVMNSIESDDNTESEPTVTTGKKVINIQDKIREVVFDITDELDNHIDKWIIDPDAVNFSNVKVINLLKGKGANAHHAKMLKSVYAYSIAELKELSSGNADEDLREAYEHRSRKQIRALIAFYDDIVASCNMIIDERKASAKPRSAKTISKEKLVSNVRYMKMYDQLKLVSINPIAIIDSRILWVYQTKTRKLGKYVAMENGKLSVKGSNVIGYDTEKSIQRTLKRPAMQLGEFKSLTRMGQEKYIHECLLTVETSLNGRLNDELILLKVI